MSAESAYREKHDDLLLHELSPHQIAHLIRDLDSRLIGIVYDDRGEAPILVYSFEVAGRQQEFAVIVDPPKLVSIADLYPEAVGCEQALQEQFGLTFQKASTVGR
jgi:hypothetical protein